MVFAVACNISLYLLGPFSQHFSVVRRGDALLLFEDTAEIERIIISYNGGYFCYIVLCRFQKTDSIVDPDGQDVLHR